MTTTAPKHPPPPTKADAASAREPDPTLVAPSSAEPDLESRVRRRRAELIAKLGEVRTQTSLEMVQLGDRLKARLSEVGHLIKEGVVDGWASLGDSVKHKLERWLSESERSLATQAPPATNGCS
jgi:hypothetical protein